MKWVSTDAWRGYKQPEFAVAGSSDTGTWSDSPCPSPKVTKEISMLSEHLRNNGFAVKQVITRSSNAFMGKRWVVVPPSQFKKAKLVADKWIAKNKSKTNYIHDAD